MTDSEYIILDELYFVTSYANLRESTELSDEILKENIIRLVDLGWVKVYLSPDEVAEEISVADLGQNYASYSYLASKKGLLAHNAK